MLGEFAAELVHGLLSVVAAAPADSVRRQVDAVREAVRPHPQTMLHAADGSVFTGVVVVEENMPVVMICVRRRDPNRARHVHWSENGPSNFEDGFEY